MRLYIVPNAVGTTRARVWIGHFSWEMPKGRHLLEFSGEGRPRTRDSVPVLATDWKEVFDPPGPNVVYQWIELEGLAPATRYRLRLFDATGKSTAKSAEFRTLPDTLPGPDDKPFTVLLGSCYCREGEVREGHEGAAGRAYAALYKDAALRPDAKFLCGDQVYLDAPPGGIETVNKFIAAGATTEYLRREFIDVYRRTWTQSVRPGATGFGELLRLGANFFVSDDHEFWNNYPDLGITSAVTLSAKGRARWKSVARPLFFGVQMRPADGRTTLQNAWARIERFEIGPLSFLIADTRADRVETAPGGRPTRFMRPEDLATVCEWAKGLEGPGVLCLSQSLIPPGEESWTDDPRIDAALWDYEQYEELVAAVRHSDSHDLVLLSGDVHFGRIARSSKVQANRPPRFLEVISSPMALIDNTAKGIATSSPGALRFPRVRIGEHKPRPVSVDRGIPASDVKGRNEDHFMTIGFGRSPEDPARVRMRVAAWLVRQLDDAGLPRRAWDEDYVFDLG